MNIYIIFEEEISDRRLKWVAEFFFLRYYYFLTLKCSRAQNSVFLKSITIKFIASMMKRSVKISDDKWRLHIKTASLKLFLSAIKYPFFVIISYSSHPVLPNYFVFNICKCLSDDYPFAPVAYPRRQVYAFFFKHLVFLCFEKVQSAIINALFFCSVFLTEKLILFFLL